MEEEPAKNRKAMVLAGVGCMVVLFLFGCMPLAAVMFWWT